MAWLAAWRSRGQMLVALNPEMIFLGVRVVFSACEVHSQRVRLSTGLVLLVNDHLSLIFLKAILNGLKQLTSKGWSA